MVTTVGWIKKEKHFPCRSISANNLFARILRGLPISFVLFLCFGGQSLWALDIERAKQQYADTSFKVVDISEVTYDSGPAIGVTFSVPLNPLSRFSEYLNVSLKQSSRVEGGWVLSETGTTAYFTNIEPETEYSVTVYRGISSVTQHKISSGINVDIKTRSLKNNVSFASSGHVLPLSGSKGLPVYTVNINEVDVDFHRVDDNEVADFIQNWSERLNHRAWKLRDLKPYMQHVHTSRFTLNPPRNKRFKTNLPVKDILSLKKPGVYVAVMKPAGEYNNYFQATYFLVSDLGLHARFYEDHINVYFNSLQTADPIGGVSAQILSKKGEIIGESRSSPDGLSTFFNPDRDARILLAKSEQGYALLRLKSAALDLSTFEVGHREYRPTEAFIYAPRDLYRPGETVNFNALLRDDDGSYSSSTALTAVIKQPDNRDAQNTKWFGNDLGYYQHEYQLPKNSPTGEWQVILKIGSSIVGRYRFKVEEFLPERMKLTLDDGVKRPRFISPNDTLKIPVNGQYLYGAPASGNRLSTVVNIKHLREPFESLDGFEFGDINEINHLNKLTLDDIRLNTEGEAKVKVEQSWLGAKSPLNIESVMSLYETGGRPVTRSISYFYWPVEKIIGIRPMFDKDDLGENTIARFEVISSDKNGKLYKARDLDVRLVREHRNGHWVYTSSRGWRYEYSDKHYVSYSTNLTIDKANGAEIGVPVEWGSYRLEIRDSASGALTSLRFRSGWRYGDAVEQDSARPDQVKITLDKRHYKAGDVANVTLTPPYAGKGFVVVEGERAMWWERVDVPAEGMALQIPVEESWDTHNLYISTVLFRPSQQVEDMLPNRAIGLKHLPLNREDRKLDISIHPVSKKVIPKSKMTTTLRVQGVNGADRRMMLTLAAVDVGVLNITDFKTPDAHAWFFEPRRYQVDSRDMYGSIIDSVEGGVAIQRFGGDADLSRGGKKAQSDVQIVSLFSGPVIVDRNGEVKVSFDLPDFNGKLRLMALAFTKGQMGMAEEEVTVAAPVVAEISIPRFLAASDHSTLTLDVHNLSDTTQNLTLDFEVSDPLSMEEEEFSVILADKEKHSFTFKLRAEEDLGKGNISLDIKNDPAEGEMPIRMVREWSLNVRPAYPAITRSIQAVLPTNSSIGLSNELEDLIQSSVEVELLASTKPPLDIRSHMKGLLRYPYGCLEQTTSSTYPWVFATRDKLTRLGLADMNLKEVSVDNRLEYLEKGLQRIKNLQKTGGGFGLWTSNSSEEHWLTAYAVDFMLDAKDGGVSVDEEMLKKATQRLISYVQATNGLYGERWSREPLHYRFAYRSYAAYVLSRMNRAPLGDMRIMFDRQFGDAKSGLPLVHLGIALKKQGDERRGMKAIREGLKRKYRRDRAYYYGDYGSEIRDLSQVVYLLSKHDVAVDFSHLLFDLAVASKERIYLSTQERLSLFKAGVELASSVQDRWLAEILINKVRNGIKVNGDYRRSFVYDETKDGLQLTNKHVDNVYAQVNVSGYSHKPPAVKLDEIEIFKEYYDMDGNKLASTNEPSQRTVPVLKTGDLVLVHIKARSNRRIPDALLIDLLPAGLELENQNLNHSMKLDSFIIDGQPVPSLVNKNRIKHQEFRDDRYVAAFELNKWNDTDLVYLARVVTPGNYTIPPAYVEDMYRPFIYGISHALSNLNVDSVDSP